VRTFTTPYAAHLRVYEPLAAFTEPERSKWAAYAEARRPVPASAQEERLRALTAVMTTLPLVVPAEESGDAFVLRTGVSNAASPEGICVCPWQTRLRSWEALSQLPEELAGPLLDIVAPRGLLERAMEDHVRWRAEHPEVRSRIVTSTWHVPVFWFIVVDDAERQLTLGGAGGDRSLVYRTPMSKARRRLAHALRTVRRALDEGPVTEGVEQMARWLEEFHPASWVELDYGGLVHLVDDDHLESDHSAGDVARGLASLANSDGDGAAAAYSDLTSRWMVVQRLEHAN
jgi:hypothetical protein